MRHRRTALVLLLWLAGCDASNPCDKDQVYEESVCLPAAPKPAADGGMRANTDAGADEDAGRSSCSETLADDLDRSCTGDPSCGCAAPFCAVMPGQTAGTCTVHCRVNSHDCPNGYTCFDVSVFGVMGIDPFCLKM